LLNPILHSFEEAFNLGTPRNAFAILRNSGKRSSTLIPSDKLMTG
jgi:hypothetical protein